MRRRLRPLVMRSVRRGRWIAPVVSLALGCSPPPEPRPRDTTVHARTPDASVAPPQDGGVANALGRVLLTEPPRADLDFVIEPVPGERSVLFISQHAQAQRAFVRRQTEAGRGPVVEIEGAWAWGGFDSPDGTWLLVTSDGERICVERRREDAVEPMSRGCAALSPAALAQVGDRLALIEVAVEKPPEPKKTAIEAPRKKKSSKMRGGKKSKNPAAPPRPPAPKLAVDVRLRWVSQDGIFEPEARSTGLVFKQPQEGLAVLDAAGIDGGVELLWASWVEPRAKEKAGPLGRSSLVAGVVGSDGRWQPTTQTTIATSDLGWGRIEGHLQPRLVGRTDALAYVARTPKGAGCRAMLLSPSVSSIAAQDAVCQADPWRLASRDPVTAAELATYERLLAAGARRATTQSTGDVARVAWTGERAFFLAAGGELRSMARASDGPRDEPHPFPAKRSRIAWGAFDTSGAGLVAVDGRLVEIDASGARRELDTMGSWPWVTRAPEHHDRLARIGGGWWMARGDVVRITPAPLTPDELRGHGHPDASVLVGGETSGLLLELVTGRLEVTHVSEDGTTRRLPGAPSPVRHGFAAVPRAGGGAIVAGVDAGDPTRIVAAIVEASGALGPARPTSLRVRAGDLAVRLVPLPAGGAWLTNATATRVVWLDEEAREMAAAPWPAEASHAACLDGVPARVAVPSPRPGTFVRVAALATAGTCTIGASVWARDGSLRVFTSNVRGLDAFAEALVLPIGEPATQPTFEASAPAPPSSPSPAAPRCPADMVEVAPRGPDAPAPFCVDRFESMLVEAESGLVLSPDHPTVPGLLDLALSEWTTGRSRTGDVHARAMPLPLAPPPFQRGARARAVSKLGVRPSGYVSGNVAAAACEVAGKRLCTAAEFVVACRGERDTLFPYGDTFEAGACNVFRDDHPAAILHGNASIGHLDPRLNRVTARGEPLLHETGATPRCASRWGVDAIYDMVGNVDEWVDEAGGAFAGGFYARATRAGCEALITAHPPQYLDYSTGVRCCRSLPSP